MPPLLNFSKLSLSKKKWDDWSRSQDPWFVGMASLNQDRIKQADMR